MGRKKAAPAPIEVIADSDNYDRITNNNTAGMASQNCSYNIYYNSNTDDDMSPVLLDSCKSRAGAATDAFKAGDSELSKLIHNNTPVAAKEKHIQGGEYLKDIVYGGLDGILEQFAIVAGVEGSGLHPLVAILLGVATLFADAVSMALGDFLSEYFYNKFVRQEAKRERWECENYLEGEQREMVEIYMKKGLSMEDAKRAIKILSKYTDMFVNVMMVEELGLMPVEDDANPLKNAIAMFFSFVAFGAVPLIVFGATSFIHVPHVAFGITCGATALTLFVLGMVKGRLSGSNMLISGTTMALTGISAASAAYLIGFGFQQLSEHVNF